MKTVSLAAGLLLLCTVSGLAAERVSLKNEYLEVLVDKETGRFTMRSTGGDPLTTTDDNRFLLYDKDPPTSCTTIALDEGRDVSLFGSKAGRFIQAPVVSNDRVLAVWQKGDCEVTQILGLDKGPGSVVEDAVSIAYRVRNLSSKRMTVGIRILLDPTLGDIDGVPYQVPGHGLIESEYEFRTASVPQYWYSYDNLTTPRIRTKGTLQGPGLVPPDRVVFAAWQRLAKNPWKFVTRQGESFRQSWFGARDSVVALFYDSRPIEPAGSWSIATLYGLYGIQQPKGRVWKMTLDGNSVAEDRYPFRLRADIQNTGPSTLSNCCLSISLPPDFRVLQGEAGAASNQRVFMGSLARNETRQVYWDLLSPSGREGVFDLFVTLFGMTGSQLHTASLKRQISIQSTVRNDLPSLSTNFSAPLVAEPPKTNLEPVVLSNPRPAIVSNLKPIVLTNPRPAIVSNPKPVVLTNPPYRPPVQVVTNSVRRQPIIEVLTVLRPATVRTNIITQIIDLPDLDVVQPTMHSNQSAPTNQSVFIDQSAPTNQGSDVGSGWKTGIRSRIAAAIGQADSVHALMTPDEWQHVDRLIDDLLLALTRSGTEPETLERMLSELEDFLDVIAVHEAGK